MDLECSSRTTGTPGIAKIANIANIANIKSAWDIFDSLCWFEIAG